jgi:hypothetical protein
LTPPSVRSPVRLGSERPTRRPPRLRLSRRVATRLLGAAAVSALLAGVALRFVAHTHLWLDEAQSVAIARLPLPSLFAALRQDGSPPLYYLLLHYWMGWFGTGDTTTVAEQTPLAPSSSTTVRVTAFPPEVLYWGVGSASVDVPPSPKSHASDTTVPSASTALA